jgi:hypothetical protein
MKAAVLSLVLALGLSAQAPIEKLKGDLQSLHSAGSVTPTFTRQLGTHILLMAEKTHEPAAPTLRQFCENLVNALSGRVLKKEEIDGLVADIQHTMQSAGTSTIEFMEKVQDFQTRLTKAGVSEPFAQLVAANLKQIGREVQGPEDTPLKKLPRVRQ